MPKPSASGRSSLVLASLANRIHRVSVLVPFQHVVSQFTGGVPLRGALVGICDVVLEILAADAPEPPGSNLKSAWVRMRLVLEFSSSATCSMVRKRLSCSAVTRTS
jgi:hypothetical protein